MNTQTVWVPFSVLNGTPHSAGTRLVWLLLGSQPAGSPPSPTGRRRAGRPSSLTDKRLCQLTGLDAKTISTARAKLSEVSLASCYGRPHPSCAAIPWLLLTSAGISASARLLYGQLQGVPDFIYPSGSFSYAALSGITGSGPNTLKRAVAELTAAGWLAVTQANRTSPFCFKLQNPISTQLRARISSIRRKVKSAPNRGETLLREFLNLLVALDDHEDNATPDFLLNPFTGELMELDRFYPTAGVAFEFNGAQHYAQTDLATYAQTVKQVGRDAMKAFICTAQGIELVVIHPEDLSQRVLDQKIPMRLPRRNLEGIEPLMIALEEMGSEYRERSAEERERKATSMRGPRVARRMEDGTGT